MKRIKISIHPAFFALLLFLYASLPGATKILEVLEVLEVRVVGIHNGDTVTLLMADNQQVKIRLALMRLRATRLSVNDPSNPCSTWFSTIIYGG